MFSLNKVFAALLVLYFLVPDELLVLFDNQLKSVFVQGDFIYPIILSIIAAYIFWLINEYEPKRRRTKRIRPIVDLLIKQLLSSTKSHLGTAFELNSFRTTLTHSITLSECTQKDFEFALQNKFVNSADRNRAFVLIKNNPDLGVRLLDYGQLVVSDINKIQEIISEILIFKEFCSDAEILFLYDLKNTVSTYLPSLTHELGSAKNPTGFHSVNPSISYVSHSMDAVNTLLNKNSNLLASSEDTDPIVTAYKNKDFYLVSLIYQRIRDQKRRHRYRLLACLSELNIGFPYEFRRLFREHLEHSKSQKTAAISIRGFIIPFLNRGDAKKILEQVYGDVLNELLNNIRVEARLYASHYSFNSFLFHSYSDDTYDLSELTIAPVVKRQLLIEGFKL